MLYPAAGFILWLFLGGLIGVVAGKVTRAQGAYAQMANMGVGAVTAVLAGFVTTFFFRGEQSNGGFWASLVFAVGAALLGVTVYRLVSPRGVTTIR